ncbi:MAG: formate/nitrite transporter family protein, partial [Pseudomonadota bacterium]|nr:formate/nitrite transporter family protein [Pseudomonadota bacterium]
SAEQFDIFMKISDHSLNKQLGDILEQAIPAGIMIAELVWMLPSSSSTKFWVIMLMTYIIAIGDFAHIVAGSTEAFLLMINGATSISHGLGYLLMAGLGNIIGGTGLFALMAYAQVKEEM